jgi:hypothetical protein
MLPRSRRVATMVGMKTLAGGWTLTGVGALLGLGSSLAITIAGPSVIDPARSCRYRFDEARTFTAHQQQFPPRTTCVRDDGQTFEYLSSRTTTVGAVLLVAAALLLLAGAALLAATWLRRDARPEPPRTTRSRPAFLWLTLLTGLTVNVVVAGIAVALHLFLGLAAAFFVVPALIGTTLLAAVIDRTAGPGEPGRRRRAMTVAVLGGLTGLALLWAVLASGTGWALLSVPLAAAVPGVAIAAVQHLRAPRPA